MRISEELEKALAQIEENGSDNLVKLLDVAEAFEKVYKYINTSFIADEKEFTHVNSKFWCTKDRYDSVSGKTIYKVGLKDTEECLFNIEVSNIGEISFEITTEDKTEVERLIDEVNAPSSELLELVRMNADISFFTENKELVFSEKPYFALKMGNFVEGDKAVLVYKEEGKDTELNKKNAGLKYIRVDQIEGYLKNIKIDERTIPVLAYAYLGQDYSEALRIEKYYIKEGTYPKLTKEKVAHFTDQNYYNSMTEGVLTLSATGAIVLAIVGGIIGGVTALPVLPCLIVGAGAPIATGVGIYKNRCKQIERSEQKEDLIANARVKTYSALKKVANENISYQEREFARKRAKKEKQLIGIKIGEKINPTETIRDVKKMLSNIMDYMKEPFYNIMLSQILNAYTDSTSTSKDAELCEELSKLADEINNYGDTSITDLVNMTFATIKRLSEKTNINSSLEVLNSLMNSIYYVSQRSTQISNNRAAYEKEVIRTSLELMLQTVANGEGLSVETLASITSSTRTNIVDYVREFSKRVEYFDDAEKRSAGARIRSICNSQEPAEVRIIKSVKLIDENDLVHDLLGKKIKSKEEKQKVKEKVEQQ